MNPDDVGPDPIPAAPVLAALAVWVLLAAGAVALGYALLF